MKGERGKNKETDTIKKIRKKFKNCEEYSEGGEAIFPFFSILIIVYDK